LPADGAPQQLEESIVLPSSDNDDLGDAERRRYGRMFRRRGHLVVDDRLSKYE